MGIMLISKSCCEVPFVDLRAQYKSIASDVNHAISSTLHDTDFILGHSVELFEQEFAAFCGVKYAIGVDSGTSALELALRAAGIGQGDEVITAANSYIASALAISHTGATPVLVDADPQSYTMDISALDSVVSARTKAIIPVHLYGHPADISPVVDFASRRGLFVLEDACQAHGARYKGVRVGSLGHAAAFSFYPGKNLGAYGDGGMVTTNDEELAASIRRLRNYGQEQKYVHLIKGYNRRLDTLQASILRVKLRHLDSWNAARHEHASIYAELLSETDALIPHELSYAGSVWHLYVVCLDRRDEVKAQLLKRGIMTGIHYPIPIHLQPAYRDLGYTKGDFPVTERLAETVLSLPMYAELTIAMIEHVTDTIRDIPRRQ